MLLTRQSRRSRPPELSLAPMIDVVFLLLIFFMCTTSFRKMERDMPSQMPEIGRGKQQDFDPVRILVSRVPKGVLVRCNDVPCATFDALIARLRALRAIAEVPVVIEGQPDVPFGYMVATLDAAYQAEFRKVAFSAKGVEP